MSLEYVAAYFSYLDYLQELSDAECGRLFKACLIYGKTGAAPELRGNERFVWPGIKSQIDRDAEKYNNRCRKNAANSGMRWDAIACERMRSDAKHAKEKEKEKAKEKESTPHTPQRGAGFDQFWTSYPKKVGKEAAKKAFDRVNVPVETLLAAIERQKCSDQWSRDNGRYIPNPATWLNQGRWEDELGQREEAGSGERQERYFTLADLPGAVP